MLRALIRRNTSLFFKDKAMFFTALITPMILLMLYATFLGNVYKNSIQAIVDEINITVPQPIELKPEILNGFVGGQLISSILAVSCVTVAICCNMIMVHDKASGVINDLTIAPTNPATLSLSYYISTLICTFIICFSALGVSFIYLAIAGFYLSAADVFLLILDVVILVMFGTALSSLINFFLKTQGQISAVGTVISSGYGFICGAYMPIFSFGKGLQTVVGFLPGTYGTSLLRRHALRGVTEKMAETGLPDAAIGEIRDSVDYSVYLFGKEVPYPVMYAALIGTTLAILGVYVLLNVLKNSKARKKVTRHAQNATDTKR